MRPPKARAMASLWTPPSLISFVTLRVARSTTEYEPVEKSVVSTNATLGTVEAFDGAEVALSPNCGSVRINAPVVVSIWQGLVVNCVPACGPDRQESCSGLSERYIYGPARAVKGLSNGKN